MSYWFRKFQQEKACSRSKVIVIRSLHQPNEKWEESKTIEPATNESISPELFGKGNNKSFPFNSRWILNIGRVKKSSRSDVTVQSLILGVDGDQKGICW